MHIILGATGHVGSALTEELLRRGEPVTVLTRDGRKASGWAQRGARVAVADARDVASLRDVFRRGKRLFLLNPPAAPSTDPAVEERATLGGILDALAGSGLEKVVALSTYGAQPGERIGDLGVLYEMEQRLAAQPIAASVVRAAYLMSNWDAALATARSEGVVHTFYPPDFALPMVAPRDVGRLAARLLTEPAGQTGLSSIEGPAACSPADVAAAFAAALGRRVVAVETPRARWREALEAAGFSAPAAESMAAMTALTLEGRVALPPAPERGATTLEAYVGELVRKAPEGPSLLV